MAKSTVSGIGTCNPNWLRSNRACLSVCTFSGEPSGDQIRAYLLADFFGLELSTKPCSIGNQSARGISITRGSDRNCSRYRRTACGVGAAGVPRLTSNTAVLAMAPCSCFGSWRECMPRGDGQTLYQG